MIASLQRAVDKLSLRKIDMRALGKSVNASIRSSGPVDAHTLAADAFKRALEVVLNRVAMGLTLPARKRGPVVGNDHFQPSRHP